MASLWSICTIVLGVCLTTVVCDKILLDEDVKTRLVALETLQRESQAKIEALQVNLVNQKRESHAEIEALRQTVAEQKITLDQQSENLRIMGQDLNIIKASQNRQQKQLQMNKRMIRSLQQTKSHVSVGQKSHSSKQAVVPVSDNNDNMKKFKARNNSVQGVPFNLSKRQGMEGVAFTAYLSHNVVLGDHQVIKFDKIITNDGSAYNNHTGIFTCIMDGMYLFYFAIGERGQHQQVAALNFNSQNIIDSIVEGFHASQDLQGGNMATIRLRQGDSVWVESIPTSNHLEGSSGLRLTSFTGVFLYP